MLPEKVMIKIGEAALIAGLLAALWGGYSSYKADMAELHSLRDYKTSVETRGQVSEAAHDSFQAQKNDQSNQRAGLDTQRVIIETRTAEVAREDQATADFLSAPIPERLRAADREARLQRGLGSGDGARRGADQAH